MLLIESCKKAHALRTLGRPCLVADYGLQSEIRCFDAETSHGRARVDISARIRRIKGRSHSQRPGRPRGRNVRFEEAAMMGSTTALGAVRNEQIWPKREGLVPGRENAISDIHVESVVWVKGI
jgi:hypothetical protein